MDTRGPDEFDDEQNGPGPGAAQRKERDRDALTPEPAARAAGLARTVQLVSGDFLLTVNPVDGSEIEPCPPGEIPGRPERRSAAERTERERSLRPPGPCRSTRREMYGPSTAADMARVAESAPASP
ncbi:hypothetical protein A8W25_23235 [Streptomyces sp. ERV7]|uniref:hypothetical protein n=1 Tax=Streptomyces sp. ERV7 TaxID=1322334 RepID=UPI0007F3A7D9|nr:hypothetical protein [Streptomyces sp. ERV7]OAR22539.1 hypothetical protein A8W25_23235 [Streptomyces sp. ERV7]